VLSICYYRASLDGKYCTPEFVSDEEYRIEEGYHPLLENPVPNSITLKRGLLLTGSNASGKSTFLKMSAINSIFAQTIHTCTALAYRGRLYRIYSSMALRDDLNLGDSYYMAEIKSLKRVIDAARDKEAAPVLCFVDEVLRGTNTTERIAASSMVLDYFTKEGVFCFAATHDGELCGILADKYDIYHFEGDMTGGDVIFDYRIRTGPATTRNAIKLLESIGYDKSIVTAAEAMAEYFDKEGIWKRCK
jgi:DNA mismatch repair ATPase MutS